MNSADKLWELKKLEYRIDHLGERLERRAAAEKLCRPRGSEFQEESHRISAEFEDLKTQISKLLEDKT